MSRVMYQGKRLIPAPLVTFEKAFQTTEDGTKINSVWNITITGRCLTYMGSPNSSGVFWTLGGFPPDETVAEDSRLGSSLRKQEAIRELFSEDGHQLEWQSEDATAPIKCNPRIKSVTFQEGLWWNDFSYTINLEADILYVNGQSYGEDDFGEFIETASETWQIETDESNSASDFSSVMYRVSHSISAKGKRFFDDTGVLTKPAWEQAKEWVVQRTGFDTLVIGTDGVSIPGGYNGYNLIRSENIEETNGVYSITENWVVAADSAYEKFDISIKRSADTGLVNVSIEGSVTGLEVRSDAMVLSTSKYTNAQTKFDSISSTFLTRAQTYSGETLNIIPLSSSIGKNITDGVISYSYEYNTRPTNLIPTSLSERIMVNDAGQTNVVAIIPVLGRSKGPVLQDIGTSREQRRTLDIEAVFPIPTGSIGDRLNSNPRDSGSTASAIASIITAANPLNNGASKVFIDDDNDRWDITEGRYSLTITWVFEN